MAALEFFLAIDLSDHAASRELLRDVATRVLTQAGCGTDLVPGAIDEVVAKSTSAGERRCRVTFEARDGRLDIVVSSAAGPLWQTTESIA